MHAAMPLALTPSWNPIDDVNQMLSYAFMRNAFATGTVVAIVAGIVGYFVVLRHLAFAAHSLAHIGFAGAAGALVVGASPIAGLLAFTGSAAAAMGALGKSWRSRDTAIGMVLTFALGLGVLFLSLYSGYATQAYAILFGEILGISAHDVVVTACSGAVVVLALLVMYRPLLFASLDEDVAEARGVRVRVLGILFMLVLAVTVTVAVQVVGVLLIFALIVAPAAIAERFARTPAIAIAIAIGLALAFTWAGLAVAFYTPWPVSFFITTFAFGAYVSVGAGSAMRRRLQSRSRRDAQEPAAAPA
jgi:zinc/manganese transport system permease protein